jgi:hypothetical protein
MSIASGLLKMGASSYEYFPSFNNFILQYTMLWHPIVRKYWLKDSNSHHDHKKQHMIINVLKKKAVRSL